MNRLSAYPMRTPDCATLRGRGHNVTIVAGREAEKKIPVIPSGTCKSKMEIADRVALITVASEGIGARLALQLRQRGAELSLLSLPAPGFQALEGDDTLVVASITPRRRRPCNTG